MVWGVSVSYTHLDVYKRQELIALQDEITRIADTTKFNGKNLINSAASKAYLSIQVLSLIHI